MIVQDDRILDQLEEHHALKENERNFVNSAREMEKNNLLPNYHPVQESSQKQPSENPNRPGSIDQFSTQCQDIQSMSVEELLARKRDLEEEMKQKLTEIQYQYEQKIRVYQKMIDQINNTREEDPRRPSQSSRPSSQSSQAIEIQQDSIPRHEQQRRLNNSSRPQLPFSQPEQRHQDQQRNFQYQDSQQNPPKS